MVLGSRGGFTLQEARIDTSGGFIDAVDTAHPGAVPEGSELVDLGGHLLTPAFVNAHSHLALSFLRGVAQAAAKRSRNLVEDVFFRFESLLSADDVRAFARMGAYESLLQGVGSVWDHYYQGEAVAAALRDTGLSGVVAPTVQDLAGPGRSHWESALDATVRIAESQSLREHGIAAALGPHATDTVSPRLFRQLAELAEQHGLPVHLHVGQSYDELRRIEAREGRSPLSLLAREGVLDRPPHVLMAHGIFVSDADLHALDPDRHTLAYCPSAQTRFAFPAPMPRWCALGVDWVVATDCAAGNDSMNLQKELRLCAGASAAETTASIPYRQFLKHGREDDAREAWAEHRAQVSQLAEHVTAERLLARVWQRPGSLHPSVKSGSIEPGFLANFVAWNTRHPTFWPARDPLCTLAMGDTTGAIHALFVRGETIGELGNVAGALLSSNAYGEALEEADRRLSLLLARAGESTD